jgi:hypothetical protein
MAYIHVGVWELAVKPLHRRLHKLPQPIFKVWEFVGVWELKTINMPNLPQSQIEVGCDNTSSGLYY